VRCQFERSRERGKLFTAKRAKYYAEERKVFLLDQKERKSLLGYFILKIFIIKIKHHFEAARKPENMLARLRRVKPTRGERFFIKKSRDVTILFRIGMSSVDFYKKTRGGKD
jgi:hypothetical protein